MSTRILILEFEMYGIDVDLIYAQIPFQKIGENFDIMDYEIIEENKNKRSILALAGVRCLKIIRQYICQNQELLVLLMRYVKIWAKNRLIYSNKAGYLSSVSLAIMSAKICIEYPQATSLSFVIKQFFNLYNSWDWEETPLLLVNLIDTDQAFENDSEIVEPWRGFKNDDSSSETGSSEKRETKNEGNDGTQMSIITPGFPEQNTTFNVNKFTLKRIVGEIERGFALIEQYSRQESTYVWNELITPLDWKTYYNYFILILCRAGEFEKGYCNRQKVLLRTYLYNWEKEYEEYNLIKASHLIPNYEENVNCLNTTNDGLISCKLWIVGVNLNSEYINNLAIQEIDIDIGQILTIDGTFKHSSTKPESLYSVHTDTDNLGQTLGTFGINE
uniref:polynucleotide adenylyltransferase n=1 Tax=Meloidogyne enterolobii TaxID=390850 RepID=A0A6V7XVT6_MELEN|nr:unnamed protein product [Meloidogyne enterolobii]